METVHYEGRDEGVPVILNIQTCHKMYHIILPEKHPK